VGLEALADQLDRGAHWGGDKHLDGLGKQRASENLISLWFVRSHVESSATKT
jgi:hypothetical protein